MTKMKKVLTLVTLVGVIGAGGAVYAANSTTYGIASELTGKSVEELRTERAEGKTLGTIAKEAGKLEEFKQKMIEQKKSVLDKRVEEGAITKEKADEIYNQIKENQVNCDADGKAAIGKNYGVGFGRDSEMKNGLGKGNGDGSGMGRGKGTNGGRGMGFGRGMNR